MEHRTKSPLSTNLFLHEILLGFTMSLVLSLSSQLLLAADTTEVVIVGTLREIGAMPPDYTPGHLRALLERVKPDVLAVEAPVNATDPLKVAPPEIVNIVQPWAVERSTAVVPIGWNQEQFAELTARALQELQSGTNSPKYLAIEQKFQRSRAELPPTAQALNSDGYHQAWREYHRSIHDLLGRDTPWETWNAKILDNVQNVIEQNPGKRIVVVIGAAHVYYLLDGLAGKDSVRLIRLDSQLPLAETEIVKATLPIDYLHALSPLNANVLPPPELKRMEGLLVKLKATGKYTDDYHLLRGKFLLHVRQPAEALKEFEQLGHLDRKVVSHIDSTSSLFETGLVYTALALLQTGDIAAARTRIQSVLADSSIAESTRRWAQQVSSQLPPTK